MTILDGVKDLLPYVWWILYKQLFAIVEEDFNRFAYLEQRYYVEMLNNPCGIKEMDQEFEELVVGLNPEYDE